MEGVILFADDDIFDANTSEYQLFHKLNTDSNYPILPINDLSVLEKTVSSISTYKAIILDWNFKRKDIEVEDDVNLPDETPYKFLTSNKIYSLVYIYSRESINIDIKNELTLLYAGKIFFESKAPNNRLDLEYQKVLGGIKKFEEDNQHLVVPFKWSQAINQSAQTIFSELEAADVNWVRDLYETAQKDGVEPSIEVVNLFHNLLSEKVIQNSELKRLIETTIIQGNGVITNPESYEKLFRRFYYGSLAVEVPIMTGDIFSFGNDEYGVLITPECDIRHIIGSDIYSFEFLTFKKNSFSRSPFKTKVSLKNSLILNKAQEAFEITEAFFTDKRKEKVSKEINDQLKAQEDSILLKAFTQTDPKLHILPSFKFDDVCKPAMIDFRLNKQSKKGSIVKPEDRICKLNSPYIDNLRQRYFSYMGRIGVPAIPNSLREHNLK